MPNKKDVEIPMPGDLGNSFEEADEILNYRPRIEYVEPDPQYFQPSIEEEEEPETIDDVRDRTQNLVNGLDAVAKLVDIAQKRVDARVKAGGGMTVKLDAKRDYHVIAAMKRRFPDKEDPTQITYDDYKAALDCLQKTSPAQTDGVPRVTAADIRAAKADPNRTSFGGSDNTQGENRAELSSPGMEPIDLEAFQKAVVLAMHKLLQPLDREDIKEEIRKHKLDTRHGS